MTTHRKLKVLVLAALLVPAMANAESSNPIRLSEPVEVTATHEVFGAPLGETESRISLAQLIGNGDSYQGKQVLVETRIAKVCQKKGCFFIAQEGEVTARVSFEDYGFFVPTDSGGKSVILLGTYSRQAVSSAEAEHFSSDLGEPTSTDPSEFEHSIIATAVAIPRS